MIALNHPDMPKYLYWGAIEVLEEAANETVELGKHSALPNLTAYNTEDAEKIILETTANDADLLKKWLEAETRRGVRQAISRRLNEFSSGEE